MRINWLESLEFGRMSTRIRFRHLATLYRDLDPVKKDIGISTSSEENTLR